MIEQVVDMNTQVSVEATFV